MRIKLTMLMAGAAAALLAAACAPPATVTAYSVDPCTTDAAISCDSSFPHLVGGPIGTPRNQLVVFLHGAGAQPQAYNKIQNTLQNAGFHVINLRYPGNVGTGTACPDAVAVSDPDCHRAFRAELAFGAGVADPTGAAYDSPAVNVNGANSVVGRLSALVDHLAATHPTAGWDEFQTRVAGICTDVDPAYGHCRLDWSKVVVMGHSLGGGVALYLSKFEPVARAALLSAPFDEFQDGPVVTVAPWITEGGFVTPPAQIFALEHTSELMATPIRAAWDALGLPGGLQSVDAATAPYGDSHRLTTQLTPACPLDSNKSHNSTGQDLCTPGSPAQLAPAWTYLAGA